MELPRSGRHHPHHILVRGVPPHCLQLGHVGVQQEQGVGSAHRLLRQWQRRQGPARPHQRGAAVHGQQPLFAACAAVEASASVSRLEVVQRTARGLCKPSSEQQQDEGASHAGLDTTGGCGLPTACPTSTHLPPAVLRRCPTARTGCCPLPRAKEGSRPVLAAAKHVTPAWRAAVVPQHARDAERRLQQGRLCRSAASRVYSCGHRWADGRLHSTRGGTACKHPITRHRVPSWILIHCIHLDSVDTRCSHSRFPARNQNTHPTKRRRCRHRCHSSAACADAFCASLSSTRLIKPSSVPLEAF